MALSSGPHSKHIRESAVPAQEFLCVFEGLDGLEYGIPLAGDVLGLFEPPVDIFRLANELREVAFEGGLVLHEQEQADLLADHVPEVADHQLVVQVDPEPQLEDQRVLLGQPAELDVLGLAIAVDVFEVACENVVGLGIDYVFGRVEGLIAGLSQGDHHLLLEI
jgi:hypothetical protein